MQNFIVAAPLILYHPLTCMSQFYVVNYLNLMISSEFEPMLFNSMYVSVFEVKMHPLLFIYMYIRKAGQPSYNFQSLIFFYLDRPPPFFCCYVKFYNPTTKDKLIEHTIEWHKQWNKLQLHQNKDQANRLEANCWSKLVDPWDYRRILPKQLPKLVTMKNLYSDCGFTNLNNLGSWFLSSCSVNSSISPAVYYKTPLDIGVVDMQL